LGVNRTLQNNLAAIAVDIPNCLALRV